MNFADYIDLNEAKNTHMTHIEDRVIYGGVNGTREAIFALRDLRDMLGGVKDGSVSVKWDGAPAIFCGTDPSDGKFFVAKKGIFNKNPKIYKTNKDIDDDTSGALNKKMKLALQYLPDLGIKGVIQGDFLYGPGDLSKQKIKGKKYVTFHPNTIVYAVPDNTPSAIEIKRAKIGIVWHTTYTGNSFEDMKASFGKPIVPKLKKSSKVWMDDATYRDVSGTATFTAAESKKVTQLLSRAGLTFKRVNARVINDISTNQEFSKIFTTFNNTYVRAGTPFPSPRKHLKDFFKYICLLYTSAAADE